MQELVKFSNGKVTTTSLKVAEVFSKNHKDVLRAIRDLDCSDDFNQRNFAPVEYQDSKGEKRPMYNITRDGFTLLVMGFTGEKAMKFKEAYIHAFNIMEQTIKDARTGMLTVEDVKNTLTPIISENERLKFLIGFAKNFLPNGNAGDKNKNGIAKNQFRRGYYCANKGKPATALIERYDQPGLFDEVSLVNLD